MLKAANSDEFRWILPPPVVGLTWIGGLGVLDWLTGPEVSISAFYLPAVAFVAWFSGRWASIMIAVCAALAWLLAELACGVTYSIPLIPYWNSIVRFCFFLITAILTSEVRTRQRTEAALREQRGILKSILDSMRDGVAVIGGDGIIIGFNPAAERIFGGNALGMNAKNWLDRVEKFMPHPIPKGVTHANPLFDAAIGHFYGNSEISIRRTGAPDLLRLGLTSLPLLGDSRGHSGSVIVISDMTARRELEKQISEVSEREQRRIGQDLHDGVCQHLVGVAFAAGTLQADLENRGMPKPAKAAEEIAKLINDGIGQARNLAHGLYPVGLEEGLETALLALASTTRERAGIACHFKHSGPDLRLDAVSAVHLYRIAQECLANAIRHASPKTILITLTNRLGEFELCVTDDGSGMNPKLPTHRGIGLHIMKYRANLIGGKLEVDSTPGKGTRVICSGPCSIPSV